MEEQTQLAGQLTVEDAPGASREIRRIMTIVKRTLGHWRVFVVMLALGVLAGGATVVLRKPGYRSETVVLYREGIRGAYLGDEGSTSMRTLGTRLKEMLVVRPQLEAMIDEFGLYQTTKEREGYVAAVDEFRADIQFKARATDTFWISYSGKDPETVQLVTARLADALIKENNRLRIEQAKVQSEFMTGARQQSDEDLKTKERTLAKFLAAHPEFALDTAATSGGGAQGATIRAKAKEDAAVGGEDAVMAGLRRQAARIRATLEGGDLSTPAAVIEADPALVAKQQQAQSAVSAAQGEVASAESRFTEAHPDVQRAKKKLASAQVELAAATKAVQASKASAASSVAGQFDSPEVKREKLSAQLKDLEAQINQRKKAMSAGAEEELDDTSSAVNKVVALETQWARLNREVQEARVRVEELEQKSFRAQLEASSALGGYGAHIAVIDPAYKPTRPNPPGKTLIMALAVAAALGLGLIIALLRAIIDDRIYDVNDLARISPVLAVVPKTTARGWFRRG